MSIHVVSDNRPSILTGNRLSIDHVPWRCKILGVGGWRLAGQHQLAGEKRSMGQLVMVFWERCDVVFIGLKGLHAITGYHVKSERKV